MNTMVKFLLSCLIGILLNSFLFMGMSYSQLDGNVCSSNDAFRTKLFVVFKEKPITFLIKQNGDVFVLYVNRKTGTWTIGLKKANLPNITCIASSGIGYIEEKKDEINYF